MPYTWEEALGWEQRPPSGDEDFAADERKDWWYHWKSPGLLKANPLGMVPTLLDETSGKAVHESIVCVEFIDEMAAQRGSTSPPLLPRCPFDRASARVAADKVSRLGSLSEPVRLAALPRRSTRPPPCAVATQAAKTVCSSYYKVLVRTDPEERREGFEEIKQVRGAMG